MDRGVNFQRLFERSPYSPEVLALYKKAHLSVRDDLAALTRHANIHADRNAIQWLERTSVPSGHLQVPELDMHTIADQLVPVQQENYYRHTVDHAGSGALLRQAYVERQSHCNFTPAELVAGVLARQPASCDHRPLGQSRDREPPERGRPVAAPRRVGVHRLPAGTAVREQRAVHESLR